jgi:hypothetical protein
VLDVPNARLDYLAPGTVIGINPGGSLKTIQRRLRPRRHEAPEGRRPQRLRLVRPSPPGPDDHAAGSRDDKQIGQLITTIGAAGTQVNSVITKIAFDLKEGTVTIHTQFGQFDPTNIGP